MIAEPTPVQDSNFVRRDTQNDLFNGTGQVAPSIAALDLSQVRRKLMEPAPEGKGWSQELAHLAEKWYRRYLHIVLKYPDVRPVPNHQIDDFWHQHILDTRAYARDCHGCVWPIHSSQPILRA